MVACGKPSLRGLSEGDRSREVRFGRLLANPKVTAGAILAGGAAKVVEAARGRGHVLTIQDTSEINFSTTKERRRGLGQIGKGTGYGVLLHALLALDADSGACLGLLGGEAWTRADGPVAVPHALRELEERESMRWLRGAETARSLLPGAAMVTVVADRESDIYDEWALLPGPDFHLLSRAMQDRRLAGGGSLFKLAAGLALADTAVLDLRKRGPDAPARKARLELRFGRAAIRRPARSPRSLPASVELTLVEVVEPDPPAGVEPLHWRLLTTHRVETPEQAWRVVGWYKARWAIEQFFRTLKLQGLRIEDSQLHHAPSLVNHVAVAARAAVLVMQLVHSRQGQGGEVAGCVFEDHQLRALDVLDRRYADRGQTLRNPHPRLSLAWAAWIVARLGGWNGYRSSRPPGPVTFFNGLRYFNAFADGFDAKDVCIP